MTAESTLRVKLLFNTGDCRRIMPGDGVVDGVSFSLDRHEREYDWLAVYSDFVGHTRFMPASERLGCHPDNTLLMTHEPPSVKRYNSGYAGQFNWVLSCHDSSCLMHPRLFPSHPASPWFYPGRYGELLDAPPPEKVSALSTVCSDKSMSHTLHKDRVAFTRRLAREIPEMAVYGKIGEPLGDKREAIAPYRMHLAIENHVGRNHWTEKLADAFLGCCLPLYCGCSNVFDFFPEESLIPVDVFRFGESCERIRKAMRDDEYAKRFPAVREARRRVLAEHNLFVVIAKFVRERHSPKRRPASARRIWNHSATVRINPVEGVSHVVQKSIQQWRHFAEMRRKRKSSDLY